MIIINVFKGCYEHLSITTLHYLIYIIIYKTNSFSIIIQPSTMCGLYSFSKETCQYKPQYAFKMSMFMCPAVHINSRSLLRSSSTHEPSDPPLRVNFLIFIFTFVFVNKPQSNAILENMDDIRSYFISNEIK